MKVAANTVERILIAAEHEVRESGSAEGQQVQSIQDVVEAFRKYYETAGKPYHVRELRGLKSGKKYPVIVTTQTKTEGGVDYVLCLVIHEGRKPFKFESGGKTRTLPVPPAYREQWVRSYRIGEVS